LGEFQNPTGLGMDKKTRENPGKTGMVGNYANVYNTCTRAESGWRSWHITTSVWGWLGGKSCSEKSTSMGTLKKVSGSFDMKSGPQKWFRVSLLK